MKTKREDFLAYALKQRGQAVHDELAKSWPVTTPTKTADAAIALLGAAALAAQKPQPNPGIVRFTSRNVPEPKATPKELASITH